MHRLFKSHNLMNIFFAVLVSIPLISIGVRCAYVTLNKNAYQSYYGETINEKIETQVNWNELTTNKEYLFNNPITPNNNINNVGYMFVQNVVNFNEFNNNVDLSNVGKIRFYKTENYNTLQFYDTNETTQYTAINLSFTNAQFTFEFLGYSLNYTGFENANYFYELSYNKYSYLDNVFEYSVNQFISSNDLGNLNFFTWFNGVFFTNNAQASTYINFINWYLNYMILVSCGYILFLMLMWFVNFVRKLLDRSMNIYDK